MSAPRPLTLVPFLIGGVLVVAGASRTCNALRRCDVEEVTERVSPNSERRAFTFVRCCGATVALVHWIAILPADEAPDGEPGNVVGIRLPQGKSRRDISVEWVSNTHLSETYPRLSELFAQQHEAEGVRIVYSKAE